MKFYWEENINKATATQNDKNMLAKNSISKGTSRTYSVSCKYIAAVFIIAIAK